MSLILEALKRSEKGRQDKTGAAATGAAGDDGGAARSPWRIAAAAVGFAVAGLAIGGAIGFFGLVPPAAKPPPPAAALRPTPPVAAKPAQSKPATEKPAAAKPSQPAAPAPASPAAASPPPTATAPSTPVTAPVSTPAQTPPAVEAAPASPPTPDGRLAAIAVPKRKPAAPSAAPPTAAGDAPTLTRRGRAYEDKGLLTQAIATYGQAIDADPEYVDAWLGRGWARVANGAFADAAGDFQRGIALRPDVADGYFGRGWALEQAGDREQAIGQYGEAIRRQPDHAEAYFSRGVLQFMAGRMAAAARDFAAVRQRATGQLKDYALLWRYVSEARGGVIAPTVTLDAWRDDKPWPGMLAKLFRGQATPTQVLVAAKDRDPVRQRENECIALFFLGQQRLIAGDATGAAEYFRRTLATGVTHFRQYAAARAELDRLTKNK